LVILIFADFNKEKKWKIFTLFPPALIVVFLGALYEVLVSPNSSWAINDIHLVNVPSSENIGAFLNQFTTPNFNSIMNTDIWIIAVTIAVVASLETLLCVNATDKLDPKKRATPANRELIAQGAGNFFSGLIGGIPVTQVIVRSSANIQAGAKSKFSAIFHGFLLLISVILIPDLLNKIPLSVLAAILLIVGYNLVRPSEIIKILKSGVNYYLPFLVTIICIVLTDLLTGIVMGLVVSILINPIRSLKSSHQFLEISKGSKYEIEFNTHLVFYHKKRIFNDFMKIPQNSELVFNLKKTTYIGYDIKEMIGELQDKAKDQNITIVLSVNSNIDLNH
jgi:MFS superfamily sulfate permease-like transporter